jgi:hypothetical protein
MRPEMKNEYHILNGDSLKEQFPNSILGNRIIARLCLVDGDVKAETLSELFKIRAKFISESYSEYTEQDYYLRTVTEIEKIQNISENTEINLWFEDDLFCQVNFWFIINLIFEGRKTQSIFLVRPKKNSEYSFGKMNKDELVKAFQSRIKIETFEINELRKIWKFYQQDNYTEMLEIGKKMNEKFPFLISAIMAHKDRLPRNGNLGRPKQTLIQIMEDLKSDKFYQVFAEFCKREEIYGFGDLQVKRMFDEIIKNH